MSGFPQRSVFRAPAFLCVGALVTSLSGEAWAQTPIYYSVGTNSADLKNGNPSLTVTITAGTAVFSVRQHDHVGVGDEVTYNGGLKAYIASRTDGMTYTLVTANGAAPGDAPALTPVDSIRRTFNSLDAATAGAAALLGTSNLVSGNYQLNWPCYNDGPDTSIEVQIAEPWITGVNNYIRVYTPTAFNEVGASQRHRGVAGTGYRIAPSTSAGAGNFYLMQVSTDTGHVRVEGIELDGSNVTNGDGIYGVDLGDDGGTSDGIWVSHSLIHGLQNSSLADSSGLDVAGINMFTSRPSDNTRIWNNIIYDIENVSTNAASDAKGIRFSATGMTHHVYNNTVYDVRKTGAGGDAHGIEDNLGAMAIDAKNNYVGLVQHTVGGTALCYNGTFASTSNNVSSDGSGDITLQSNYDAYFQSTTAGSEDFHLQNDSNALWGSYGADVDGDPNSPVTDDVDGAGRDPATPDIGADEFRQVNFRSIGSYSTGDATITAPNPPADADDTIDFAGGASLPLWVDPIAGERTTTITIDAGTASEDVFTVASRDSAVLLTITSLTTNANFDHANSPYTIVWRYERGTATVPLDGTTVTFGGGASLPTDPLVGLGDKLTLDPGGPNQEVLHVLSRDGPTQVTLQTPATQDHSASVSYWIERAYASLQDWETDRQGNLVADGRLEVGVAYNDGPFTTPVEIQDSTTDAMHYMFLTAVREQQHDGTEGTGVVFDGSTANLTNDIHVRDDFTVIKGLEMRNHVGDGTRGAVGVNARHVLVTELLVHDFNDDAGIRITGSGNSSLTVRNSIVYNGSQIGVRADEASDELTVENVTVYGMTDEGIREDKGSTVTIKNSIVMNNGAGDICVTGSPPPCAAATLGTPTLENNMSSDPTALGPGSLPNEDPLNEFINSTGPAFDFHLAPTANAIDAGQDLSARFCCDIDRQARPGGAQWDMGADEINAATAVELLDFSATGSPGEIVLEWETGSELDNLGFHLYRAGSASGPFERRTAEMIPGLGSSPAGASYRFRDADVVEGVTYYYELEDIETTGRVTRHGPVSAAAVAGGTREPDPDGAPARITFGDPERNTFRVLEHDRDQIVLELITYGFIATPVDDGSGTVRLEAPGLETLGEPDAPALPVKHAWVDAIAGRKVRLVSVRAFDASWVEGLTPERAGEPVVTVFANGTVRAGWRRNASRLARRPGLYPPEAARLVDVGFQQDVKKAHVELAPLRWDAATGRLLLVRRLLVRLSFHGREPLEHTSDGLTGRRSRRVRGARRGSIVARLSTEAPGLYGVRYEDLFGRSRTSVDSGRLRLTRRGVPIAFHLETSDRARFGPGSVLYFVSDGHDANPYGREAVYELELGERGEEMKTREALPAGAESEPEPSFYWHRLMREQDRFYQAALVTAPDRWLWEFIFSGATKAFAFDVSELATSVSADAPRLAVWLQGTTDFPETPDHHVRVYVNGVLVDEVFWEGKEPRVIEVALAPGVLTVGENALEIENVGDTEARYSMVMLDRFEVEYPRRPEAVAGRFEGRFDSSGIGAVSAMASAVYVVDVTEPSPSWLRGAERSRDGRLRFQVEAGRRYLAVSAGSVLRPQVKAVPSSTLKSPRNGADYLMIGPRAYLEAAEALLEHRRREGFRAKAVSIEEVFSEFGFGETDPQAIQEFVAYAYHQWTAPPPRYVVLLGDASFDFKDNLATGEPNPVPPFMVPTAYMWTVSDPSYAAVNGDDVLPDLAIGRIPASSAHEVSLLVEKILAYERGDASMLGGPLVLVTDNADSAGNFRADAEAIALDLSARSPRVLHLSELGVSRARDGIVDAFDAGASVISYLGHGGIHLWAAENLFDIDRIGSLAHRSQQPLVLTMTCLNGYFHFPYGDSLSEELVKAQGKGAIATISPSGLSLNRPAHRLHQALLHQVLEGGHRRVGDAVLAAQEDYAATGAFPELLLIYQLLGDPALVLR